MRRYALTAELMKAPEAHSLGLIHQVVEENALTPAGNALADLILTSVRDKKGVRY